MAGPHHPPVVRVCTCGSDPPPPLYERPPSTAAFVICTNSATRHLIRDKKNQQIHGLQPIIQVVDRRPSLVLTGLWHGRWFRKSSAFHSRYEIRGGVPTLAGVIVWYYVQFLTLSDKKYGCIVTAERIVSLWVLFEVGRERLVI